ncbi:MAG: MBL fold metallo-hydrolase [Clostridiales bacterium]|nr:MBL fold metallo-hydrolase [Clostridiales bacterium]
MKITFTGAAKCVTGSNHYVEIGNTKLLVDCGMFQGSSATKKRNYDELPYNPAEIDFVLLTHAHIDHSGRIPLLYKKGYKGEVLCTRPTAGLCEIMLPDSAHIQESEAEYKNRKRKRSGGKMLTPLYTMDDAKRAIRHFKPIQYNNIIKLNDEVSVRFRDAGHILGSAAIEMWCKEDGKTVKTVFSGDLGKFDTPIIRDPFFIEDTDYLVIESTYGNRLHEHKQNREKVMFEIIEETLQKGGTVIIPSFAVGRTQEMIYGFNKQIDLKKRYQRLKRTPVYIDSPLAISATEVFKKNEEVFDDEAKEYIFSGDNPLDFENLIYTPTADESKLINTNNDPKIIISASGMCDAGRIKHHLKHNLWKKDCTVLFVGYQAQGTLGRRLVDGEKSVRIFNETIEVNARIVMIDGFSGHGDKEDLDKYIEGFKSKPKKVFLVHGEEEQIEGFSIRLQNKYGLSTLIPNPGQTFELSCYMCEDTTPEPNRELTKQNFQRLELLNMIKKVNSEVGDLTDLISNEIMNSMDESEVRKSILRYSGIENEIKKLAETLENRDGK